MWAQLAAKSRSAPDGRKIECVDSIAKSENDKSYSGIAENINGIAESIRSEELSGSTSDLCLNLRESMKSKDANCVQDMENCACSESNNAVQTLEKDNAMHLDSVSNNETLKCKITCDENHVVHDNITNSTESMTKERVGNFPSNSGLETATGQISGTDENNDTSEVVFDTEFRDEFNERNL